MPQFLDLPDGYVLRLTAVDPATGAFVAGVRVNDASLFGANLSGAPASTYETGPWMLVPGPGA